MDYNEAFCYIKGLTPRGIVPGLGNISALCQKLQNPQDGLNFVHIAGTNGKGSVGAFLEAIIKSSGKTVGRFVSPFVSEYLETFTVNGENISPEDYAQCVTDVKNAVRELKEENIYPTAFEAETAIAFLFFKKYRPDYILLECGMGGLLDSTNIIKSPLMAVITSISKDHSSFLGDTAEEIAKQKAGIIKQGINVVSSVQKPEIKEVIEQECQLKDTSLFAAENISDINYMSDCTEFIFENEKYVIPLCGTYQPYNAAVAIKAAKLLGFSYESIYMGLKQTKWQFRFEKCGKYILDGAHNAEAAQRLAESIGVYLGGRATFICGCFKDKDYKNIVKIMSSYAKVVFCVTPPTERGLDSEVLRAEFEKNGIKATACGRDIKKAVKLSNCFENVVVFGSLSILNEIKKHIKEWI
jgi:dihydrofolate synthase/folylpolyglutamate synthase